MSFVVNNKQNIKYYFILLKKISQQRMGNQIDYVIFKKKLY